MSWEMVKLAEICETTSGGTPSRAKNEFWENGNIPWIKSGQLKDSNIYEAEEFITPLGLKNSSAKLIPSGTLLLALYGATAGKLGFLEVEATINQAICALTPNQELLSNRYLFYYLLSKRGKIIEDSAGGAQPNISQKYVQNIEIPLPPLSTQQRIAEILDKADALRRKDQALLKKYDDLAQAIFMDMFGDPVKNEMGWEIVELASLCSDIIDCPHSTPNHSDSETEFPCIRTSEMKNGRIVWDSMKYLNEEEYHIRTKRLTPKFGDIVYAREGRFGEAILIPEQKKFALGQRTMLLRVNSNICDVLFLWYQLNSRYVYSQALKKTNGSTVGHINVSDVKTFSVLFPNLELQKKFSERISVITKSFENILNQVKYSEILFQSLLQQAFKGDLV